MSFAAAEAIVEVLGQSTDWVTEQVGAEGLTEGVSSTSITGVKLLYVGLLLTLL